MKVTGEELMEILVGCGGDQVLQERLHDAGRG